MFGLEARLAGVWLGGAISKMAWAEPFRRASDLGPYSTTMGKSKNRPEACPKQPSYGEKQKQAYTPWLAKRRVWLRGASGRVLEGRVWAIEPFRRASRPGTLQPYYGGKQKQACPTQPYYGEKAKTGLHPWLAERRVWSWRGVFGLEVQGCGWAVP